MFINGAIAMLRNPERGEVTPCPKPANGKSLESWIWDAACSHPRREGAPKYKDYILPLIFTKRLCDVFDDEINRIAAEVGSAPRRLQARRGATTSSSASTCRSSPHDPEEPVWSVIRKAHPARSARGLDHRPARHRQRPNPALKGIIDRVDFNATTHGQRDIDDDRLSNLIERSAKSDSASTTSSRTSSAAATST